MIDSVSTLFAAAYPSNTPKISGNRPIVNKKYDVAHWAANRRWSVLAEFTAAISKLASAKNLVVLLLSQVNTKFRRGAPATLRPALHTKSWTKSVDTRIVLFRDWLEASEEPDARETRAGVRFASIAKFRAVSYAQLGNVVPFRIEKVSNFTLR